ncbi:hypothetical protein BC936DRAFT_139273, partial [Jimgerdemannia flammicorona]
SHRWSEKPLSIYPPHLLPSPRFALPPNTNKHFIHTYTHTLTLTLTYLKTKKLNKIPNPIPSFSPFLLPLPPPPPPLPKKKKKNHIQTKIMSESSIHSTNGRVVAANEIVTSAKRTGRDVVRRKLVIVGDGACGKTSLLSVFTLGYFPKEYVSCHIDSPGFTMLFIVLRLLYFL